MKILILMPYYNRPILVKNALNSILKNNYDDWELVFGDDSSIIPGRPIVEEVLKDHLEKVRFIRSDATFEEKIKNGLVLGKHANEIIENSNADLAVILCDDDELYPDYFHKLNFFFKNNSHIKYCFSKVCIFNPIFQKSSESISIHNKYNKWDCPINPVGKVDASQVAWRLDCCKKDGAWFSNSTNQIEGKPWIVDTDKSFFQELNEKCGLCYPTRFFSQYKAIHDYQLLWHKDNGEKGLFEYKEMCDRNAGVLF